MQLFRTIYISYPRKSGAKKRNEKHGKCIASRQGQKFEEYFSEYLSQYTGRRAGLLRSLLPPLPASWQSWPGLRRISCFSIKQIYPSLRLHTNLRPIDLHYKSALTVRHRTSDSNCSFLFGLYSTILNLKHFHSDLHLNRENDFERNCQLITLELIWYSSVDSHFLCTFVNGCR